MEREPQKKILGKRHIIQRKYITNIMPPHALVILITTVKVSFFSSNFGRAFFGPAKFALA
jgi:hypothetical protein